MTPISLKGHLHVDVPVNLCSLPEPFRIIEVEGGLPHSEILGSKPVRGSPRLIAAYHVLHRLLAPRHPPNALMTLDCSHYRRPPLFMPSAELGMIVTLAGNQTTFEKTISCFERIRERCGQAAPT